MTINSITTPEIRNTNFIAIRMDKKEIELAFIIPENDTARNYILSLIGDGYLTKSGDRYYKPTLKLLDLAFIPDQIDITPETRRFLTANNALSLEQLQQVFNRHVIRKLLLIGYFFCDANMRYRKTDKMQELLAEGDDYITLK